VIAILAQLFKFLYILFISSSFPKCFNTYNLTILALMYYVSI